MILANIFDLARRSNKDECEIPVVGGPGKVGLKNSAALGASTRMFYSTTLNAYLQFALLLLDFTISFIVYRYDLLQLVRSHGYICIVLLVFSAMLAAQYGSSAPWWAEFFEVLGIAHLFLLIFSAKSLVFFFGVCVVLQFTLLLSKARAQRRDEPIFSITVFCMLLLASILVIKHTFYPSYRDVFTPTGWAVFFSWTSIINERRLAFNDAMLLNFTICTVVISLGAMHI